MAGGAGLSRGCVLLLVMMTCVTLISSDHHTCQTETLENTTVDIRPAVNRGARSDDPVYMPTRDSCVGRCCSARTISGDKNCSLVIFDSRKRGSHPNCYLFHCPTEEACPTKPSPGITSFRVTQDKKPTGKLSSKTEDSKSAGVDVNKKNALPSAARHSDSKDEAEGLDTASNVNKAIASKILDLAENIEKHLDQMDQSLEGGNPPDQEVGQTEEEKEPSKSPSIQKPQLYYEIPTKAAHPKTPPIIKPTASRKITTTTQATTSMPTMMPPTTLPTTALLTTTTLPTTTTLTTTTTLPTTTSTVTTTLPTTTSTVTTTLSTTTSTTLATTTSMTTQPTTTVTTTVIPITTSASSTAKSTDFNYMRLNQNIFKVTSPKVVTSTSTSELKINYLNVRPEATRTKPQNSTTGNSIKIHISSLFTPLVPVDAKVPLQNANQNNGLQGSEEERIVDDVINPDSKAGDRSGLVAALVFGVVFVVVVLVLVTKRALESLHRRHYSRLDYLINGMYIDT